MNSARPALVRHPTSLAYRNVLRWTDARLAELVAGGIARPRQAVDAPVLERMRGGFFASAHAPR